MRRALMVLGGFLCAVVAVLLFGLLHRDVAQGTDVAVVAVATAHPTVAVIGGTPSAVYMPKNLDLTKPVQVLMVLHGMGGSGAQMIPQVAPDADAAGWLVVAPDLPYNSNYKDVATLTREDPELAARLVKILDDIPHTLNVTTQPRAFFYGFSRGAQIVHRFGLFYPERVAAVAAISAGSYTLPLTDPHPNDGVDEKLPYPYGISDLSTVLRHPYNTLSLRHVPFQVEIGGADNNPNDVPRAWDGLEGNTRLARAETFVNALRTAGVQANLKIYPGVGHTVTPQMAHDACTFFKTELFTTRDSLGTLGL